MAIFTFLTSKPSLLLLSSLFQHIKFMIYETACSETENYSAIAPHPFLLQIYTEW